ncbi:TonB-dependent receptor [Silvibacterium dinghuense]|uniref:TonB-dependent receptor n=1 Tax=Silvibacterium dinghuense TaxID=1560006 RepID=A0A4Q1SJV1_9BACT|nr:TonB-dependent receptor [Silvibacterium dinghuense]
MPLASFAQVTKGSISGTVVDASGASIGEAALKATNTQTGVVFQATTEKSGTFHFSLLPPGTYKIEIISAGFDTRKVDGVVVTTSQDTGLGAVTLGVAGAQSTVEVSGSTTPLIETTQAQVTNDFSAQTIASFANVNENQGLDNLALLVPGVNASRDLDYGDTNGAAIASNGSRGRNNDQQIDGQNNNDNSVTGPALQVGDAEFASEYQIITNNFGPEYGRNGGSVINVVTKSGTNNIHGSIYGNWTNNDLETLTPYQKNFDDITENPRSNTEFAGFTIGFPILKDRVFFFNGFDQQLWHESEIYTSGGITPTQTGLTEAAACGAVNANALSALNTYGPFSFTTGNPKVVGTPIESTINGNSSCPIEYGYVQRSVPERSHLFNWLPRVDYSNGRDTIVARYILSRNSFFDIGDNGAGGWFYNEPSLSQAVKLGWTRAITQHIVNELSVGFDRENTQFGGSSNNSDPSTANLLQGVTHVYVGNTAGNSSLAYGPATNLPQGRIVNTWQLQDNFNYQLGNHHLKAGVNWTYQRSPNTFLPYVNGEFYFSNWSNYMTSTPYQINIADGKTTLDFREYDTFLYAGDDWQIKPNLTLNLGLTWSTYGQPGNLFNKLDTESQESSDPLWDPSLPLSVTTATKLPADNHMFGPSIGFAWTPGFLGTTHKTVLRGGYRLSYDPPFYNIYLNTADSAPQVLSQSLTEASEVDSVLPADPTGANVRSALSSYLTKGVADPRDYTQINESKNFRADYVSAWSFGVQRELSHNLVAEVRYVGNHGGDLFQTINANPYLEGLAEAFPSAIPSNVTWSTTNGREDGSSYIIRQRTNTGYSDYHALQSELRANDLFHQLMFSAAWTWSKTTDNSSEIFSSGEGGNTSAIAQNPLNYKSGEHGLSGLDFPQNLTLNFVENIPFFKEQHGLEGHVLGGWGLSGNYFIASGQTYTPIQYGFDDYGSHSGVSDYTFNGSYGAGPDNLRPFLGSRKANVQQVGAYAGDVCAYYGGASCNASATTLISWNNANKTDDASVQTVSKSDVRYIMNSTYAQKAFNSPWGNVARNDARDFWTNTANLTVTKNFKLNEKMNALVRANFSNVFNHPNYSSVDPYLDDAGLYASYTGFGNPKVTTSNPRQATFSAKISW